MFCFYIDGNYSAVAPELTPMLINKIMEKSGLNVLEVFHYARLAQMFGNAVVIRQDKIYKLVWE